ncbi:transporter substrate-binding domain-containing protein [Rhodospirillaceae bacterium KN72]|uniref:Transporter substrate-binding domain-containing protein n=1 Tax=Pacificispira spongiicola TaxID=2729598 RepID=A0A7Y0E0F4_9PROT|nr:transporter substrate-binding domain-containing protein [Pacificispira spongiicola]NMM44906.1 transporter substrate-binding domain-containing protein [Pacificispira spongiicola]
MKFAYLIEPPFNDRTESGDIVGCDVDLARHVFAELGIAAAEFVETSFGELLPGLNDGRWRMTTGLFATDLRREAADFSRPIWALPDGLLVRDGNPLGLTGYRSLAASETGILAVIRDQFQHHSARKFGVPDDRIAVFETYSDAATAVRDGHADAYASVARAHAGYLDRHSGLVLDVIEVPADEKPPAFGCFAFAKGDDRFREEVDRVLAAYLGSPDHRRMMHRYGFSDREVDLVVAAR